MISQLTLDPGALSFLKKCSKAQAMQLLTLYKEAGWWSGPEDGPEMVQAIVAGSHCFCVARKEGRIVGMARAISDRVSDAYIQDVFVTKKYRGAGIGSMLLRKITGRLQADGLGWIALVAQGGSAAFYRKLGFAPMAEHSPMKWKG